jgi:hypothetical protein
LNPSLPVLASLSDNLALIVDAEGYLHRIPGIVGNAQRLEVLGFRESEPDLKDETVLFLPSVPETEFKGTTPIAGRDREVPRFTVALASE